MTVRPTAHWAVLGKTPQSLDDYDVIGSSTGALSKAEFSDWLKSFSSGTVEPKALPRVAASHFSRGGESWLGLSLQTKPESQDGFHRPYTMTWHVCLRWEQVSKTPISYRALYEALQRKDFSGESPFRLSLRDYDPPRLAGVANATARRAAALLLTGRPVCVVRAELPMEQRLDFLDAVAALLPYGMRSGLAVSTWTNSASRHRIRLSFAEVAPAHGAWELPWERDVPHDLPPEARLYEQELAQYEHDGLTRLIRRLAALGRPLDLDSETDRAEALMRVREHTAISLASSVKQVLPESLDSLARADEVRLHELNAHLSQALDRVTDDDRPAYRDIVKRNLTRLPDRLAGSPTTETFFGILLRLLYGPVLHRHDLENLCLDLGGLREVPRPLARALKAASARCDPLVKLLITYLIGDAGMRQQLLSNMTVEELLHLIGRSRDATVLDSVLRELGGRGDRKEVAQQLHRHRYLVKPISACLGDAGMEHHRSILQLSRGRLLLPGDVKEIFEALDETPPQAFMLAIVAESGRGTGAALLSGLTAHALRQLGLEGPIKREIEDGLTRMTAPALTRALRSPRRLFGGRLPATTSSQTGRIRTVQDSLRRHFPTPLTESDVEAALDRLEHPAPLTDLLAIMAESGPGTAPTLIYWLAHRAVAQLNSRLTAESLADIDQGLQRMTGPRRALPLVWRSHRGQT
ncbi:hypothetical protein GBF35_07575 [Nonomuraea phyllanthi]|uniref:hypothetical protein n=1 Tax=Nonomuraea phyllanthi TaxID=2219224 RepID=UPI001292EF3A|nr:hypothetical protein [Nonomuraea phyllanthi]QFY06560.1 hypothetical protein GBF35_07575 [Nonomuraea phyllanthi]